MRFFMFNNRKIVCFLCLTIENPHILVSQWLRCNRLKFIWPCPIERLITTPNRNLLYCFFRHLEYVLVVSAHMSSTSPLQKKFYIVKLHRDSFIYELQVTTDDFQLQECNSKNGMCH
jgi:hypothetical protein